MRDRDGSDAFADRDDEAAWEGELDDDPSLDEDFPLGDGTADTDSVVYCPWCGEPNEIGLDPGSGAVQEYVEDCQVCCRPGRVVVQYDEDGSARVGVEALDGE